VREQPLERDVEGGETDSRSHELLLQRNSSKLKQVGSLTVHEANLASGVAWAQNSRGEEASVDEVVDIASLAPIAVPRFTSFQNYINQGCEVDFCVAIDFTSSNGDPRLESSLHYQSQDIFNDYEETISAIGQALSIYSKSQEHSVWGFGSKFPGSDSVQHLFRCGPSNTVFGVDGILSAYRYIFETGSFVMSGPTVFTKVIHAAALRARSHHNALRKDYLRYTVLLVITDGIMDDFDETKRKLEAYIELPLSVVFVGLGRSDFSVVRRLCDPNRSRNNARFVEFRQHQHNPSALSEAALQDIPNQISTYMRNRGI
jgi:Copine